MIPKLFVLLVNHTAKQIVPVRQRIKDNYPQFSLIFDNFRRTKKKKLSSIVDNSYLALLERSASLLVDL